MLSIEGIEVFIKSVLQEVPTFVMLCFLLLKMLCKEIESIIAHFCGKNQGFLGACISVIGRNYVC